MALAPLVWWTDCLEAYTLPKRVLLQLGALALIAGHVSASVRSCGSVTLPASPLTAPAIAYVSVAALSCFKAVNPADALTGWMQQAVPALAALVLLVRGASPAAFERFATLATAAGWLASAIGLAQYLGYNTDSLGILQAIIPASVFGNKNVAAGYLAGLLPLALYRASCGRCRVAGALASLTIAGFLWASRCKAAWAAAAAVLLLFAWRRLAREAPRVRSFALSALAVALGAGLLLAGPTALRRLGGEKGVARSASARLTFWMNSVPMVAADPLLGVGPNNWYIHYPNHAFSRWPDPTFKALQQADEPHCDLVQIACETGLLGLAAFLWVLVALGRAFWQSRAPEEAEQRFHCALTIGSLTVSGLFMYTVHLAPAAALFWTAAAFLVAPGEGHARLRGGPFTAVAIAALAIAGAVHELRLLTGDAYYLASRRAALRNSLAAAEAFARESARYSPAQYRTRQLLGQILRTAKRPVEADAEYRAALVCHPNHPLLLYERACVLADTPAKPLAIALARRAIEIWPSYFDAYWLLARLLALTGDRAGSIAAYERAVQLNPRHAQVAAELARVRR